MPLPSSLFNACKDEGEVRRSKDGRMQDGMERGEAGERGEGRSISICKGVSIWMSPLSIGGRYSPF